MKTIKEENRLIVRLDPGDELIRSLERLRDKYSISSGFFMGIGAVGKTKLGHYDVSNQEYNEKVFDGQFEVTSFIGNIGPDKIHAHMNLADNEMKIIGGHCSSSEVTGTFEIVIFLGKSPLYHIKDERTGLDVFDF